MKQKIRVIDKVSGKTIEKEVEIRNLDHFNIQLRNKHRIFKDHTKYTRKFKHKKKLEDQ